MSNPDGRVERLAEHLAQECDPGSLAGLCAICEVAAALIAAEEALSGIQHIRDYPSSGEPDWFCASCEDPRPTHSASCQLAAALAAIRALLPKEKP